MSKSLTFLFLLQLTILRFVASALANSNDTQNNRDLHPAATRSKLQVRDEASQIKTVALDEPATGNAASAVAASRSKSRTVESTRSKMKSNNVRWAIHGIATELFHNVILRTLSQLRTRFFASKQKRLEMQNSQRFRHPPKHEIAVVTGATGGIGSKMAHDLAFRGYDVVIAARDAFRGKALVEEIEGMLKVTPVEERNNKSSEDGDFPTISFVQYHADVPRSALDVASSLKGLDSPLTVLINNAGIMGKSRQLTMKVNLIGPALLTFALLPLMVKPARGARPTVINVGSSAHLRATESFTLEESHENGRSWMNSLPDTADDDLSTYAQSKLALMQFSTLLRCWLAKGDPPIQIFDAHPGLVWTPLLRNHIGDKAVATLTKTGLANLMYKSSLEGAHAIVSALDSAPAKSEEQIYFVNGRPGGYAASESISIDASVQLWAHVIAPEVEGIVELPKGWGLDTEGR